MPSGPSSRPASRPASDDRVAIRSEARPLAGTEPILGFEEREEDGRRVRTETPKDYPAAAHARLRGDRDRGPPLCLSDPARLRRSRRHAPAPRHRRPGAARGHRAGPGSLPGRRGRASRSPAAGTATTSPSSASSPRRNAAGPGRHADGEDGPAAGQPGGLPARAAIRGRPGRVEVLRRTVKAGERFPVHAAAPSRRR